MLIKLYFVFSIIIIYFVFASSTETTQFDFENSTEPSDSDQKNEQKKSQAAVIQENVKNFILKAMKSAFPFALRVAITSKASKRCLVDLARVGLGAKGMQPWALKMIDSIGKLSGGILEGTTSALGDYDECLNVIVGGLDIKNARKGSYCLLEIKPPEHVLDAIKDYQINKERSNFTFGDTESMFEFLRKVRTNPNHMLFRLGICMPSSCKAKDIQKLINRGMTLASENELLPIEVSRCETKKSFSLQTHQIIILAILGIIVSAVISGTFISCLRNPEPYTNSSESQINKTKFRVCTESTVTVFSRFSICHSISKLFNCERNEDAFDVFTGINFLTIICAIFFHTYALPHPLHMYRFRDTLNFTKFIDEILFGAIANSSVGIDTFFFLGGFYFVYNRWEHLKRPSILSYIFRFIALMLIRILAAQLLIGSLFFLLPTIGSGPLWNDFIEGPLDNCRKSWWMNLLFIQNFLGPYDLCLYQVWFLATMMQIFLITAVLVFLLYRWPSGGILVTVMVITLSILIMATVTAILNYPATFAIYFYDYRTSFTLWKYVYTQSYTHIGSQCIGMLTAYFLAEYPAKKLDRKLVILLWVTSMLTMCSIIFGLHSYRNGQEMERSLAVFYAAVHRPAWALSIGWIIYACSTGHGGIINSFLTWKAFVPLERLSYMAYLLHIPIMFFQGGIQRERIFMGHYNQIMCFLSYTFLSFLLAFICYTLFQAPYEVLEGIIFNKGNLSEVNPISGSEMKLKSSENIQNAEEEEDNKSKVLYSRN